MLITIVLLVGLTGSLLILFAGIVIFVWFSRLLYTQQWRKASIVAASSTVALLALGWIAALQVQRDEVRYLEGIFATRVALPRPLFSHDPPRDFQGDGFSLVVYELPDHVRQRFLQADQRPLNAHPSIPDHRSGMTVQTWRTGPLEDHMNKVLQFILSIPEDSENTELANHARVINERIDTPRTYYAYLLEKHGGQSTNVDWYVVDLDEGRLYIINLNT